MSCVVPGTGLSPRQRRLQEKKRRHQDKVSSPTRPTPAPEKAIQAKNDSARKGLQSAPKRCISLKSREKASKPVPASSSPTARAPSPMVEIEGPPRELLNLINTYVHQLLEEPQSQLAGDGGGLARVQSLVSATLPYLPLLDQQTLANLTWVVGHVDRERAEELGALMEVPFRVYPQVLPDLKLKDFMEEINLKRDVIYLDEGTRAVPEARLTAWQSDIGATFVYSGKEMIPPPGGLTASVARVRAALQDLTGVHYDSVLINYYEDGKCGMRYHVDPLYGKWTPHSAVVSLGSCRQFVFREIADHSKRWSYRVRSGDVVVMFGDCQDRLQHCVKVERQAEDAGPRMSLVFKERLQVRPCHDA